MQAILIKIPRAQKVSPVKLDLIQASLKSHFNATVVAGRYTRSYIEIVGKIGA